MARRRYELDRMSDDTWVSWLWENGCGSTNTDNACDRIEMLLTRRWGKTENHTPVRRFTVLTSTMTLILLLIGAIHTGMGLSGWTAEPDK